MKRITLAILATAACALMPAQAWDTKERAGKKDHERDNWLAIYRCLQSQGGECSGNEHERVSNDALAMALVNNPWRIGERTDFVAVDLNASLFRPPLAELETFPQTASNNRPLEERILPPPPHFAGIPDYSYTIYDWVNKNELCPSMPAGRPVPDQCHVYSYYHGAIFNSSHFGSQATRNYQRLHQTALSLAAEAAAMLSATTTAEEREAHADAIREAEHLALAYEGYAQHFLADRWAMGHMFERWGAPEYTSGYGDDFFGGLMAGGLTGIIHGFESVLHIPDALSSPEPEGIMRTMYTSQWRFSSGPEVYNGVGDYRYNDMKDGRYGGDYARFLYTDYAINVRAQQDWMMRCLSAGFGEVIGAFGAHPDGGQGIDQLELTSAGRRGLEDRCYDPWATNYAMNVGWGVEGRAATVLLDILNGNQLGRYAARIVMAEDELEAAEGYFTTYFSKPNAYAERADLVRMAAAMSWYAFYDPNGIQLAQGGIGNLGNMQTSDNYPMASYIEPVNISSLPTRDARGRDKGSIYGLFNRAGAKHWCGETQDLLDEYRRSTDDKERAACRMLAHRFYATTKEGYTGPQYETQSVSFASNKAEVRPLCEIAGGWSAPSSYTDDTPYRLHPGYVPFTGAGGSKGAYAPDDWQLSTQSIANWCDGVPVIDTLEEEEDLARDIVARVDDIEKVIELTGLNFGRDEGTLLVGQRLSDAIEIDDIRRWRDDEIRFSVEDLFDDITFNGDREAFLFVKRADSGSGDVIGTDSVGRFVLLDDIPRPAVTRLRVARGNTTFLEFEAPVSDEEVEDPGPFADDLAPPEEPGPFRPIGPGEVEVEIEFDMAMDRDTEESEIMIGNDAVIGEWRNRTTWRGRMDLLGGDFFKRRLGFKIVSVKAKAEDGGWIDGQPDTPGDQPWRDMRVLIDTVPNFVSGVDVRSRRTNIYRANWIGGPDLSEEDNLTSRVLNDPERALSVQDRGVPPADGEGQIRLILNQPVLEPPVVNIGNVGIEMTGEDTRWSGEFDFARVSVYEVDGRIPIRIAAYDEAGKNLDGDPRTVSQINSNTEYDASRWVRVENGRGGGENVNGGFDTWHFLSAPVDLSLMIVLDASGSMGGENIARMENAKAGITETLDNLPEDKVIEVGGTIFYDCNNISTMAFTRNVDMMKTFLLGASPTGDTPLARAHDEAGKVFDASADPAAAEWRFTTITDGLETCDGNVAGAAQALNEKMANHQGALRRREPPPPDPPAPLEQVQCNPASWHVYQVETEPASPFADIRLIEHWYLERALPDGRCFGRLESRRYGVYYGSGSAASGWGVNSRPSGTKSAFGTSSKGRADLERVRNLANAARRNSTDLNAARRTISQTVERELGSG